MTLKRRYDQVMDKLEVTDEMRGRILERIREMDLAPAAGGRVTPLPRLRRYLSAAACFVVLLAGVAAAWRLTGGLQPQGPDVEVGNGIVQVGSREELAAAVGFAVEELEAPPFAVEDRVYASYWGELAEITYSGQGKSAVFRKSPGTEDNSGDYSVYQDVAQAEAGPLRVTLKGDGGRYVLAVWSAGGYGYSVRLSDGISQGEWLALLGAQTD